MKIYYKLLMGLSILVGTMIITLIGWNIFSSTNEAYIDRHIRELKYEQEQIYQNENSLINKKLEEDDGQEDTFYKEIYRQEDGFPLEGRQETRP